MPLADIARSDCADQISRYSFIDTRDGVVYLEEDCDVARYLEALEAAGVAVRRSSVRTPSSSTGVVSPLW